MRVSQAIAGLTLVVLIAVLVSKGLGEYLPQEMVHFKGWYGITSAPLDAVKKTGIHNALVFVSGERSWTEFAALDVANSPLYDSDLVFAADLGRENGKLMLLYPGRAYYRMVGTEIKPYAESITSDAR
ncbi:MAG: hypothetical protein HY673_13235 [Chloroflexi bacterium]|nr:hypothetical protein [Chloroflexota bacterium]